MADARQRSTRPWLAWLRTLALIALIVAVIAVAGGFADAPHARFSAEVGAPVDTGRRIWTVSGAELTTTARSGYDIEPSLRVSFTVTNTARSTDVYIEKGVIELVLPDGRVLDDLTWRSHPRYLALYPDIPAQVYVEVEVDPALVSGAVVVRIHDEVPAESAITTVSWRVDNQATDVTAPVQDVRGQR